MLKATRRGRAVGVDLQVRVADNIFVSPVDLLSVLGVPFTLRGPLLFVQPGTFMLRALQDKKLEWSHGAMCLFRQWSTEVGKKVQDEATTKLAAWLVAGVSGVVVVWLVGEKKSQSEDAEVH